MPLLSLHTLYDEIGCAAHKMGHLTFLKSSTSGVSINGSDISILWKKTYWY